MRRTGISPFAAGVIALVIIVPLVYLGFSKSIPFRHHFEIRAAFSSANNLRAGSPVRIATRFVPWTECGVTGLTIHAHRDDEIELMADLARTSRQGSTT